MIHEILNVRAAASYVPYQDLESKQMLVDLIDSPHEYLNHLRRYTTSLTTQMIFGFRTPSNNDPKMLQLFEVRAICVMILYGGVIADEIRDFMPGANFHQVPLLSC